MSAEEELQGDEHGILVFGDAGGAVGSSEGGHFGDVSEHFPVAGLLRLCVCQLIPKVEPLSVLFIDSGATDFELDVVNERKAESLDPGDVNVGISEGTGAGN